MNECKFDVDQFAGEAKRALEGYLDKPGRILYSSIDTLKSSEIYILGLNPGGKVDGPPISESVDKLGEQDKNAYLDEEWEFHGLSCEKADAPLQRRIRDLIGRIKDIEDENAKKIELRKICASNLIFVQTSDANKLKKDEGSIKELVKACWKVHELIIEAIQPKVIIAIGNGPLSSYAVLLKDRLNANAVLQKNEDQEAGHGVYKLKSFSAEFGGKKISVFGFPHFSYYQPNGEKQKIRVNTFIEQIKLALKNNR